SLAEFPNRDTEVLPQTWKVHKPQIENPGAFVLGKFDNLVGRHTEYPPLVYAPRARRGPQWVPALDGLFAALSCPDANDLFHGCNENLPIANAARLGRSHNRFDDHIL